MKKLDTKDKKKIIIITAISLLILTIIILFATGVVENLLAGLGLLKTEQIEPEVTFYQHIPKGDGDVIMLDDKLLVADRTGVACYSVDGTWQWEVELNLNTPVFIPDGKNKAVLGDIGGNGIYGFDNKGVIWRYIFDTKIINVSESTAEGRMVVIHETSNYLSAATLIDFSDQAKAVASRKFSQYYMMSASVTENGKQAAVSGIVSENGNISAVIVFMNLDEYELFATETVKDEILPIVSYVDNYDLFAVGGDSLRHIRKNSKSSGAGDINDLLWDRDGGSQKILAACRTQEDTFITVSAAEGADLGMETSYTVNTYSLSGALKDSFACLGGIQGVKSRGKIIVLYGENEVFAYNIYGQLIGKFDGVSQISDIEFISDKVLVVCGTSKIAKVDFS